MDAIFQSKNPEKCLVTYHEVISDFSCECSVCQKQIRGKIGLQNLKLHSLKPSNESSGTRRRFTWLLAELGLHSLSHDIAIPTPEILVFNRCRPQYLLQSSNHLLKYIISGEKLRLTEILKSYTKIVRNRKKEERPGFKVNESYGKEIALLRYTLNNKDNENLDETPELENGPLRVLSEKEFFDFMYERVGSSLWKNIIYIQTVVKCRNGIGNILTVSYSSAKPMNIEDFKSSLIADKDEQIMHINPTSYCELLCKRIDALLHFYSHQEILYMQAEFSQDDLGKIWLTYITELYTQHVDMPKQHSNEQGRLSAQELAALNADLDERIVKCQGKMKFEEYSSKMMDIYKNMKEKTDIDRILISKPINYADADLMQKLQTKHSWIKNSSVTKNTSYMKTEESVNFDPRNSVRAKQRFDLMKSYSRNDDFFPTSYAKRREWIFTPSPEPSLRNKSSFVLR